MRGGPRPAAAALAVVAGCGSDAACPSWGEPEALGEVDTATLTEASGLALSRLHDGVLWSHDDDDGGDQGLLVALGTDGTVRGTVRLTGSDPVDWEDVATVRLDGQSWIVVGDIGDNDLDRSGGRVLWVPEPADPDADTALAAVDGVGFSYPDGPVDAEALVVDPRDGSVVVLTREADRVRFFVVPDGGGEATLAADIALDTGALASIGAVRAADLSPAGDRLYLRGEDGVAWAPVGDGAGLWANLDDACLALAPDEPDGEGLAATDDGFYTLGEGRPAPLWRVQEDG